MSAPKCPCCDSTEAIHEGRCPDCGVRLELTTKWQDFDEEPHQRKVTLKVVDVYAYQNLDDEADDLRAQVAALTAERDQARAERDEAIRKATAGAVEALEHPAVVAVCKGAEEEAERLKAERDRLRDIIRSTLTHVDDLTRRCGYPYCRFEISLIGEPKPHCPDCVAHEPWFSGESSKPETADAARAEEAP